MNCQKTLKYSWMAVAACATAFGLAACSDSGSSSSPDRTDVVINLSGKEIGDTMYVEMVDSTYQLSFNASGKWKLLNKTGFIQNLGNKQQLGSVTPLGKTTSLGLSQQLGSVSGEGDGSVEVRFTTNDLGERLLGEISIEFEDSTLNKNITVVQLCEGDYPDNASVLSKSNKIYAVGYGYDALTGAYADYSSLKAEIFDTKTLIEDEVISSSPTKVDVDFYKWSGSGFAEYEEWLDAWAGVSVDADWFYGEYETAFTDWTYESEFLELAIGYVNVSVRSVDFEESDLDDVIEYNMKASAYNAINGLDEKFPSDNAGFKKLIQRYGTHVVLGATLGGRIRQAMASEQSYEFELLDYVNAAYGYTFDEGAYIDEEAYASFEEESDELNLKVTVSGGDESKALKIAGSSILKKDDVKAWVESLGDDNATLVDFSGNRLLPLYELIDESLGDDAKDRKAKLKAYMEGSAIRSDFGV